jgi:hypothetical protein
MRVARFEHLSGLILRRSEAASRRIGREQDKFPDSHGTICLGFVSPPHRGELRLTAPPASASTPLQAVRITPSTGGRLRSGHWSALPRSETGPSKAGRSEAKIRFSASLSVWLHRVVDLPAYVQEHIYDGKRRKNCKVKDSNLRKII